jgi:hypothetical protein
MVAFWKDVALKVRCSSVCIHLLALYQPHIGASPLARIMDEVLA